MRLFERNTTTYATPINAERKLKNELAKRGELLEDYNWLIGVNDEGRFYPVVNYCSPRVGKNSGGHLWLAFHGVCVA